MYQNIVRTSQNYVILCPDIIRLIFWHRYNNKILPKSESQSQVIRYKGTESSVVSSKSPNLVGIKLLLRIQTQLAICFYEGGFVNSAIRESHIQIIHFDKESIQQLRGPDFTQL